MKLRLASFGMVNLMINNKSLQYDEVLNELPNEYCKYLVSIYFMYYQDKKINYYKNHENFLVKLINKPTIAQVKPIVFNACISLYSKAELNFQTDSRQILENKILLKEQFFKANKLILALLTLNFIKYLNQKTDIKAEIEHTKTAQCRPSYTAWAKEARPEFIGNKMWLEKRPNLKAGNNYFDEKKEKYKESNLLEAQELSKYTKNDWLKEDIEKKNEEIYNRLVVFKQNID